MQRRHDDLGGGLAVLRHLAYRHATSVVCDRHRVVGVDGDEYLRAIPGERLVYRVVNDLPDQVMEAPRPCGADVHAWPTFDGFEALEDLDRTCIVSALGILGHRLNRQRTGPSL